MTTQGKSKSGKCWLRRVAVTTDWDKGEDIPSTRGRASMREVMLDQVAYSSGSPVRSITLAPDTACEVEVEGIAAVIRCRRGSMAHLNTIEINVLTRARSLVPKSEGSG